MKNTYCLFLSVFNQIYLKVLTQVFILKFAPFVSFNSSSRVDKRVRIDFHGMRDSSFKLTLGKRTRVYNDVLFQGTGNICIGENTYIGAFSVLGSYDSISIGKNVMIAQSVSIRDHNHGFNDLDIPMRDQGIIKSPIVIEDNVWIGYGVIINKGVTVKNGAILAAGAVITKDVPKNAIVGGVPGKILKYRKNNKI